MKSHHESTHKCNCLLTTLLIAYTTSHPHFSSLTLVLTLFFTHSHLYRLFILQVLDTVLELFQAGFVDLQNPTKKGKNLNEGTTVSGKEQKAATSHTSKSSGEIDVNLNLRSILSSIVKKKKKRSLRDVSLSMPVLNADSREASQTGYIVGGSNRFYETENKPKRKKLRL